ncbi:MAG: hypothetical protein QJR13_02230 [Bacillota bacterium]|nr:hypothetical protein [Bacillota bacterium]
MAQKAEALRLRETRAQVSACLKAIQEREEQIRTWILDAKRKADEYIARARKEAAELKQRRAEEAEQEAQAMRERGIKEAEEEAAKILKGIDQEVRAVQEQARRKMELAVQTVIDWILPE